MNDNADPSAGYVNNIFQFLFRSTHMIQKKSVAAFETSCSKQNDFYYLLASVLQDLCVSRPDLEQYAPNLGQIVCFLLLWQMTNTDRVLFFADKCWETWAQTSALKALAWGVCLKYAHDTRASLHSEIYIS